MHFHTLRATAITAAAVVGGTPKEVQRYGRHADAEISLRLYQRATDSGEKALSNKVFDLLVAPERTVGLVREELVRAEERLEADRAEVARLKTSLR